MKKYLFLTLFIILLIIFIVFIYFYSIWSKEHNIEQTMIKKVRDELAFISSVEEIDYFAGEKQYYLMLAKDDQEKTWMVWLNQEEIHYQSLDNWVTKEQIKQKALQLFPNIDILRTTYGINADGKLIYEIFYQDETERLGYLFFYLKNGDFIKMYRLGKTD